VVVRAGDVVLADTSKAWRVMETSHPPTWYLPADSVDHRFLTRSKHPSTHCEWKGSARYWDLLSDTLGVLEGAAWSYPNPTEAFREIAGHLAFRAGTGLVCQVDSETVRPQPGGFYAGWITDDVVGPFKGGPGSLGW